jgi:repressor LexA
MIRDATETNGYPPTVREIAGAIGVNSTNAVQQHLRELERKGYLSRLRGSGRALTIVRKDSEGRETIPFLGKVS